MSANKQKGERDNPDGTKEIVKIREEFERYDGRIVNQIDHYLIDTNTGERVHEYWMQDVKTGEVVTGTAATDSQGNKV